MTCCVKRFKKHSGLGVVYCFEDGRGNTHERDICDSCWERIGHLTAKDIVRIIR